MTSRCVGIDDCSSGYYSDPHYKTCVRTCYDNTYSYGKRCYEICPNNLFADYTTKSCVAAINCSETTLGDPSKGKCVKFCDIASNRFAKL